MTVEPIFDAAKLCLGLLNLPNIMNIQRKNRFFSSAVFRNQGRRLASWLLVFLFGGASAAFADDVLFSSGNYSVSGNTVTMTMYGIENYSASTSGTLRMELWAFTSPYTATPGATSTGFRLAASPDIGELDADSYFETNPITETAVFTPPQPGTYYLALVLSEYANGTSDDGFFFDDYVNDQSPTTYGGYSLPAFFTGENALANGIYYLAFPSGNYFGYYSFLTDPAYIYHFDLGYEYVFDANDGESGVYLYDFASNDFFYTSPTFPFPYLYDFGLQSTLYYYPDTTNPGHYTSNPRYFFDYATGQIITK